MKISRFILSISSLFHVYNSPPANNMDLEQLDPKAPLSNLDLAKHLMKYCRDNVDESAKVEREHANDKLKVVIDGLSSLAKALNISKDAQEDKVGDLEMKINTLSSYLEEHIFSLRTSLHNLNERHVCPCTLCGKSFTSPGEIQEHLLSHHRDHIQPVEPRSYSCY